MAEDRPQSAPTQNDGQSLDASHKRRVFETRDQTSSYEGYLYGNATYAKGAIKESWTDSTKGRLWIRLFSRGLFGAAAFAVGGHYANNQLKNYNPDTIKFTLGTLKSKPLQLLAKAIDVGVGEPIRQTVKFFASGPNKEIIANRAVRFRQKTYYHDKPGLDAGRSYGAEVVMVTFDFACASVGDATARSVIQLFDPALEKPWINEGKFDFSKGLKSFGAAAWRIFSVNQGEDWAAAFPYVFQMKLQRNMIAKWAPGFKLTSDMQINGASSIINKSGQIIGDYQKWGALDLQLRFMGYNWYTLMYREAYDAVANKFQEWKKNGYTLSLPENFNPVTAGAEGLAYGTRYVTKSLIKSTMFMLPSVPFFWVFRTPQSKWRAPLIYDQTGLSDHENAYVTRAGHDKTIKPSYNHKYGAMEFKESTYTPGARVWQGGVHTNGDGGLVTQAHYGPLSERSKARPLTPMGGGEAYKWENQKTLSAKLLNPFGWLSYHSGSAAVKAADKIAQISPKMDFLVSRDTPLEFRPAARERLTRTFVDAAWAYTPYMMAKAEFGLRVDVRGVGGDRTVKAGLGEMDKAIYKGIDALATFDMKGVYEACQRAGDLLVNPGLAVSNDAPVIHHAGTPLPNESPKPTIAASSIEIPTLTTPTEKILARPEMKKSVEGAHTQRLHKQAAAQERFIYPESRTLQ